LLNATVGIPGGLNACPANPLGVTGQNCTAITTSGEPTFQATQVGDVIEIDSELLRIVAKASSASWNVQRGYQAGSVYSAAAVHAGTTLQMGCGTRNAIGAANMWWDYVDDPHGTNSAGNTIVIDPNSSLAHQSANPLASINSGGSSGNLTDCPTALPAQIGGCYMVRHGSGRSLLAAPFLSVNINPPFQGVTGHGNPSQVDSHPGLCSSVFCPDARAENGGTGGMIGSAGTPFVNVAGQLWKYAGAGSLLNRKLLTTVAYSGNYPLADVSGPASSIGTSAASQYEYCIAVTAGECYAGSAAGDAYVNAPTVAYGYCYQLNNHDTSIVNICLGDIGAYNANVVQVGIGTHDLFGAYSRRLGPNFARWNQMSGFSMLNLSPSGRTGFSIAPVLDGVHTQNLIMSIPPWPNMDTVNRGAFVRLDVAIPPRAGYTTALVEFGYAENGPATSFYGTSRQETTVAMAATIGSPPFYFETSESGLYSPLACASGCVIAVPALAGRALYYRPVYFNGAARLNGPMTIVGN
jgi:hypothetical protein